ncbi:MAG: hypothetical protein P8J33_08735 [Pirellulaceae bacterium]|nr:hypothetical protein [Pirellulaceae bacterium]
MRRVVKSTIACGQRLPGVSKWSRRHFSAAKHLQDEELEELLSVDKYPQFISETIIDLANHRGGRDNSTFVIAQIESTIH